MSAPGCVIVGGGQAAVQTALSLRQAGFRDPIAILCGEPAAPYQRPPLSKAYLAGEIDAERLAFRPRELYEKLGVDVREGAIAAAVDRAERRVALEDGTSLPYDALVLATGARPRPLGIAGEESERVHRLRTLADAKALRGRLRLGGRLVIVGGGYIGLEVAAVASKRGVRATIVEALPRLMSRVTGSEVAAFLTDVHRANGVEILTGAQASGLVREPDGGGVQLALADGRRVVADDVIVAVGVVPNVELAAACGLACEDGIVVDEHGRTSDPAIFAAGDCTSHPSALLGRRLRLESVHNAIEQGKAVARAVVGDLSEPYVQAPWFWSDQYDLKLQTVGLWSRADRTVVHGDPEARSFSVLYLDDDGVVAVDAVNAPREFLLARKLFAEHASGAIPLDAWFHALGDASPAAAVNTPAD